MNRDLAVIWWVPSFATRDTHHHEKIAQLERRSHDLDRSVLPYP
jgi:hypothetical protein